jgi:hypothetical protein
VNASTRCQSPRQTQIQLPPIETSEAQPDDDADDNVDDDGDLSGPVSPPFATVNTSTRRRSSRRVVPTSSTGTPNILPPCADPVNTLTRRRSSRRVVPTSSTDTPIPPPTATVDTPTLRQCRSRRQTQLPSTETSEAQLDDDDSGDWGPFWEGRLSELADYRKIHGHCNVPRHYSENIQLSTWVSNQRRNHKLHQEGNKSPMTIFRIQALESLGFEWDSLGATWEDRLSELADYRKIHGHCNVPHRYRENTKLANWVETQRKHYKLHLKEKTSPMPTYRIQALERLGFEWAFEWDGPRTYKRCDRA